MTSFVSLGAAIAALVSPAAGLSSSPSHRSLQEDDEGLLPATRIRWSNPSIFSARPTEKDVYISGGFNYGQHEGRKAEFSDFSIGVGFTPRINAWYSSHDILLKGRQVTSRFRTRANGYGLRYLIQEAGVKPYGLAVEYETFRGTKATAVTANSLAVYPAPDIDTFRVIGSTRQDLDGQFAYTRLRGPLGQSADVYDFGVGRDKVVSAKWTLRLQAHAILQHIQGSVEDVGLEVKPVLYAALAYRVSPNAQIETDLTLMPTGTPLAFGRLTPLTGYQLYQPGGPAKDLRKDAFGVFGLRVMLRKTF